MKNRPLVSMAPVLKRLKVLTFSCFFVAAVFLILAIALSVFDLGDWLFYPSITCAVLTPFLSAAYLALAIMGRVQEEIPLVASNLISFGIICGLVVPVLLFSGIAMGLDQAERAMQCLFGTAIFSAVLGLVLISFGIMAKVTQAVDP